MKKFKILFACGILALLFACGNSGDNNKTETTEPDTTVTVEEEDTLVGFERCVEEDTVDICEEDVVENVENPE